MTITGFKSRFKIRWTEHDPVSIYKEYHCNSVFDEDILFWIHCAVYVTGALYVVPSCVLLGYKYILYESVFESNVLNDARSLRLLGHCHSLICVRAVHRPMPISIRMKG